MPVLALVGQGNGDPLPFTPDAESSIPANVNVGIGGGVMSCEGMEGAFTCVCPPVRICDVVGLGRGVWAIEGYGMGFEMLDLRSSIDVFPFPVGVPGLGFVDPTPSNLLVGLDNANAAFSSSSSTSI